MLYLSSITHLLYQYPYACEIVALQSPPLSLTAYQICALFLVLHMMTSVLSHCLCCCLLAQYTFEILRPGMNPLLNLFGVGQQRVMLGFKNSEEALGWYIYIAACANMMDTKDPDFNKVIGHQMSLAEHAAASPALVLQFDDRPERAAAAKAPVSA